jgi:hypothetical protein
VVLFGNTLAVSDAVVSKAGCLRLTVLLMRSPECLSWLYLLQAFKEYVEAGVARLVKTLT